MNVKMRPLIPTALFAAILGFSSTAFAEKTFTYTVKKGGETCDHIAKSVYGDVSRVDFLHKYNDLDEECWLGKKQKLPAGLKLVLPDPPSAGKLTSSAGKVNSKPPTLKWKQAQIGQDLFRAWQVNTLEESQAEVTFRDSSLIKMRENTLIVIYGATKTKARSRPSRARLEKGTLRTAFDSSAGGGMMVETPSSAAQVNSKSALVSVEDDGTTRVANHGTGDILVGGAEKKAAKKTKKKKAKKKKRVTVAKGMGTKVKKGKPPEPPRKLPPRPEWKNVPSLFLNFDKNAKTTISTEWEPVSVAKEYYVEISKDDRGVEIIQSVIVPKSVTRMEVKNLPVGDYFASVSTIDNDQFESIPQGPKKLRVRAAKIKGDFIQENPYTVYVGTSFSLPREIKCGNGEDKKGVVRVTKSGSQTFDCVDAAGNPIQSFEIVGVPQTLSFMSEHIEDEVFNFPKGGAFLDLHFEPRRPTTIKLEDLTETGVLFGNPVPIDDKVFRVRIYGDKSGEISVKTDEAELGKISVNPLPPPEPSVTWSAGLGAEVFLVGSGERFTQTASLGNTALSLEPEGGQWLMLEAFVGVSPNSHLSLELSLGLGVLDFDHDGTFELATSADYRMRGLLGFNMGSLNPFLQVSAGAQTDLIIEETTPVLGLGTGFNYWLSRQSGIRLDGGLGIAEGIRDDVVFFPEMRAKFVYRWK